jgi:dolichol-phosphate mannosyltransferase
MSSIQVIIPTYNEKEGIIKSIKRIKTHVPKAHIIIVDDNSPDKTSHLVLSKYKNDKKVTVIVRREKNGRGSAVIAGYKEGLKDKTAKYFVEMDADLCHDPKYIKPLVEKCKKADVVIASRYSPASKMTGVSFKRRLVSLSVNAFAKLLLQIPISDYTDGFRCYSRKAVIFICSQKLISKGYIVLSEVAYRCYKEGFIFDEIPIDFHYKFVSKSNLNAKEVREAFITLLKLKLYK